MNSTYICGLDEAGRGPLAGPVSAAAVILPPDFPLEILNDSKKLSEKKREAAEAIIKEKALWALAFVSHEEIDKINILQASLKAMKLAYEMLLVKKDAWCTCNHLPLIKEEEILAVADGIYTPDISCPVRAQVKADADIPAVMAASIIAKVGRDRLMMEYDKLYPDYAYAKHKGYPTPLHKSLCKKLGPSPIQRLTFKY